MLLLVVLVTLISATAFKCVKFLTLMRLCVCVSQRNVSVRFIRL